MVSRSIQAWISTSTEPANLEIWSFRDTASQERGICDSNAVRLWRVKDKSKVVLVEDPISQEKSCRRPGLGGVNLVTEAEEEVNVGALNNGVEPVEGDEALKVNEDTPPACRNDSLTKVVVDEAANNVRKDEGEIRDLRSERWAVPDYTELITLIGGDIVVFLGMARVVTLSRGDVVVFSDMAGVVTLLRGDIVVFSDMAKVVNPNCRFCFSHVQHSAPVAGFIQCRSGVCLRSRLLSTISF
nr:hypothetical protein Iba_chr06aCG16500 [Ipomoea batatas]